MMSHALPCVIGYTDRSLQMHKSVRMGSFFTCFLCDCRTVLLWEHSPIAVLAVVNVVLSCGSHSKVLRAMHGLQSSHGLHSVLPPSYRLEELCCSCVGWSV